MNEFMNLPEGIIDPTPSNIIYEYNKIQDVKRVAAVFQISTKEVKGILKQAGIKVATTRKTKDSPLKEIGMKETDFYRDIEKSIGKFQCFFHCKNRIEYYEALI